MRASNVEFRFRFFIFALIYSIGFGLRWSPHPTVAAEALANLSGHPTRMMVQVFFGVGALVIVLAAAIRTWATAYLHGEIVHDMAMHSDRLVADGPYRYVRNPLYLGTNLLAAGIGVLAPPPNWVFIVSVTLLFNLRLILREEAGLEAAQPQSFLSFKAAVPRLLPALTPRLPASGRQAQWGQAWLAESFMWAFAGAMLIFAYTLNARMLLSMMLGTMLAYAVIHVLNSRRLEERTLKSETE